MCFSCMLSLCKFTKKNSRKKEPQRVLDCLKDMQHTQIETFEDLPQNPRRCFHAAFLPEALRQQQISSGCLVSHFFIFTQIHPFFHHVKFAKAKQITRQFNPRLFTTDSSVQFLYISDFLKKCQPLAVNFLEKCTPVAVSRTYQGRIGAVSGPYRGRIGTVSGPYRGRIGAKNFRNMRCREKTLHRRKKCIPRCAAVALWILTSFS